MAQFHRDTGIVLKYRVPNNMDGAFQDIQRTVRLVRHNAGDWNISADRIGVIGFSAGGHLSPLEHQFTPIHLS